MPVNEDIDEKERGRERLKKSKKTGKRNETQGVRRPGQKIPTHDGG